jgi:hypothetical protein
MSPTDWVKDQVTEKSGKGPTKDCRGIGLNLGILTQRKFKFIIRLNGTPRWMFGLKRNLHNEELHD